VQLYTQRWQSFQSSFLEKSPLATSFSSLLFSLHTRSYSSERFSLCLTTAALSFFSLVKSKNITRLSKLCYCKPHNFLDSHNNINSRLCTIEAMQKERNLAVPFSSSATFFCRSRSSLDGSWGAFIICLAAWVADWACFMDASLHASKVAWVERRVTKRRITLEIDFKAIRFIDVARSENLQTEEESKSRYIEVALSSEQPHRGLHFSIQVLVVSHVLLIGVLPHFTNGI
jgi:hypothetical protein